MNLDVNIETLHFENAKNMYILQPLSLKQVSRILMSRLRMSGSVTIFKELPNGDQTAENLRWLVVFSLETFHDTISFEMTITMKGHTQQLKFRTSLWTGTTWLVMLLLVRKLSMGPSRIGKVDSTHWTQ